MTRSVRFMVTALVFVAGIGGAVAQPASAPPSPPASPAVIVIPPAAQPSAHFDVEAATEAYLAQIPPAAKARSDAYFEGGYWLILWDFLFAAVISLILLSAGWSAAMRNHTERLTRFNPIQTLIYWIEYLVLPSVLGAPPPIYHRFFPARPHALPTQTFAPARHDPSK